MARKILTYLTIILLTGCTEVSNEEWGRAESACADKGGVEHYTRCADGTNINDAGLRGL